MNMHWNNYCALWMKSIEMIKRIKGSLLILNLLLLSGLVAAQGNSGKPKEILDKMSANYQAFEAYNALFVYRFVNEMDGFEETVSGELLVNGNRFRLRLAGQEIFCDGETIWTYIEENNEVNIDNYYPEEMAMSPTRIYDAYKNGFAIKMLSNTPEVTVINLVPDDLDQNFESIDLSIDPRTYTLLGWIIKDKGGNEYHYSISSLDTQVKPLPEDFIFRPQRYPGVEIIDLR